MSRSESAQGLVSLFPAAVRKKLPIEIRVVMIDPNTSRRLNLQYRKKDAPTNVLSFRYGPAYGELLLCREIIQAEARKRGNSLRAQMTWMVVHGILHLAGIHHEQSAAAAKRAAMLEERVLRKCQSV